MVFTLPLKFFSSKPAFDAQIFLPTALHKGSMYVCGLFGKVVN